MEPNYIVESHGDISRSICIDLPGSLVEERYSARLKSVVRSASIPGFRAGKVPVSIVEKRFGSEIRAEILSDLISETYGRAVMGWEDRVLDVTSRQISDEKDGSDVRAVLDIVVIPEPVVECYRGLEVEVNLEEFTEELLNDQVMKLRRYHSKPLEVPGREVVEDGDVVEANARYKHEKLGVSPEERNEIVHTPKALRDEDTNCIPGIAQEILGKKIGEEFSMVFTAPDDYFWEELQGETCSVMVTPTRVCLYPVPELDDEFAKTTGLAETADELLSKMRKQMVYFVEKKNREAKEQAVINALIEKNPFEVPEKLIRFEMRNVIREILHGQDLPESFDPTSLRDTPLGEKAETRVRSSILLSRIAKQEGLTLSEEAWNEWRLARIEEMEILEANQDVINLLKSSAVGGGRYREMATTDMLFDNLFASTNFVNKAPEVPSTESCTCEDHEAHS